MIRFLFSHVLQITDIKAQHGHNPSFTWAWQVRRGVKRFYLQHTSTFWRCFQSNLWTSGLCNRPKNQRQEACCAYTYGTYWCPEQTRELVVKGKSCKWHPSQHLLLQKSPGHDFPSDAFSKTSISLSFPSPIRGTCSSDAKQNRAAVTVGIRLPRRRTH